MNHHDPLIIPWRWGWHWMAGLICMIFHGPVLQVPGYQIQQAQWARQSRIAARDASGAEGGTLREIFEEKTHGFLRKL